MVGQRPCGVALPIFVWGKRERTLCPLAVTLSLKIQGLWFTKPVAAYPLSLTSFPGRLSPSLPFPRALQIQLLKDSLDVEKDAAAAALSAQKTELTAQAKAEKQAVEVGCVLCSHGIFSISGMEYSLSVPNL